MAGIDYVQHGLTHQVVADGKHLHVMPIQKLALLGTILIVRQRLVHLEVVPPTGQFEAVEAEFVALAGKLFHRQIGPLARA